MISIQIRHQAAQHAEDKIGKNTTDVKKAVNVTMARLEKEGYILQAVTA